MQWKNELNDHRHFLPVDRTITRATGTRNESDARIVIHMHGPNTADTFDGFPGQDIEPGLVFNTTYRNEVQTLCLVEVIHAITFDTSAMCSLPFFNPSHILSWI